MPLVGQVVKGVSGEDVQNMLRRGFVAQLIKHMRRKMSRSESHRNWEFFTFLIWHKPEFVTNHAREFTSFPSAGRSVVN